MDWDDGMEAWIQEQEEMAGLMDNEAAPTIGSKTEKMPAQKEFPQPNVSKAPVIEISDDDSAPNSQTAETAEPSPAAPPAVKLSPEQKAVLRHVMEGKNVYFTGSAGCGKSTLLRDIIKRAPVGRTFITASTGMAALNIGGTTIHSFAGIGLGEGPVELLIEKALSGKASSVNWNVVEVLIIDEISMIHGELLTKLEAIARAAKRNSHPFGGIQLIVTGDFFQLPPVNKNKKQPQDFCFKSPVWSQLFPEGCCFELSTIFRQAESELVDLLQDVRYGRVSDQSMKLLRQLQRPLRPPAGILPTLLFSTNRRVDELNREKLARLPGKVQTYSAMDEGTEPHLSQMRKNCIAEDQLSLKVGAQVMLLKNIDQANGLVNGVKGCVTGFAKDDKDGPEYPVVLFANGMEKVIRFEDWSVEVPKGGRVEKVALRSQIPLKLGYAITVHKSQGMGLEWVEVSLNDIFEEGQGYVALSRAITMEGLRVTSFNPALFKMSQEVVIFYDQQIKGKTKREEAPESTWNVAPLWSGNVPPPVIPSPRQKRGPKCMGGASWKEFGQVGRDKRPSYSQGPFDDYLAKSTKRRALQQVGTTPVVNQQVPTAHPAASPAAPPGPWGRWQNHHPPEKSQGRATPGGGQWAMYSSRKNLPVYGGAGRGGGAGRPTGRGGGF